MRTLATSWRLPLLVFLAGLALSLPLLPATVSFEDSAEFVAAAATFGIPHPSGYPLYVLLAGLFARIPLGSVPWRVALFSAVCAAAALAVLAVVARRLAATLVGRVRARHEVLIGLVILQLAVAETWWSQAIYAKIYVLHVLLMALIAYALLRWTQDPRHSVTPSLLHSFTPLHWAFFLFGLSLSNHLFLTLVTAPFFALAVYMQLSRPLALSPSRFLRLMGLTALGLSPYLLQFAAPPWDAFVMGTHGTVGRFFAHAFRLGYGDVGVAGENKIGIVTSILGQYAEDLGPLALALAMVGFWRLRSARTSAAALWLGGAVVSFVMIVFFRSIGWTSEVAYIYRVYALPGMAAVAVAAAIGAVAVAARAEAAGRGIWAGVLLGCLAVIPAVSAFASLPRVAVYADDLSDRYGRAVLGSLPERAVLVVNDAGAVNDTELFTLASLQLVDRLRRDVTVVSDVQLRPFDHPALPPGYERFELDLRRRMLLAAVFDDPAYAGRPVYASFAPEPSPSGVRAVSNGVVFAVARGADPAPAAPVDLPLPDDAAIAGQFAMRSLVSHILYLRAAMRYETSGNEAALPDLMRAIALDPRPVSPDYRAYVAHRQALMLQ